MPEMTVPTLKITVKKSSAHKLNVDALYIGIHDNDKEPLQSFPVASTRTMVHDMVKRREISGAFKSITALPLGGNRLPRWLILVGLGEKKECTTDHFKQASAVAAQKAQQLNLKTLGIVVDGASKDRTLHESVIASTEGILLGMYAFTAYKVKSKKPKRTLREIVYAAADDHTVTALRLISKETRLIAESVNITREIANRPANCYTPSDFARVACALVKEVELNCTVFSKAQITKMNMNALLAVAQGSHEEPRFIVLEYKPKKTTNERIAFVGKGVTFDSGGISLKPGKAMDEMKYDMCGAAAVMGLMRAVALLELPVHVFGVIAATENLPGGGAIKPGDVVTGYSGKTIEILNTDAEGRLILADALSYTEKIIKPDYIIDIATLTGAAQVVLGKAGSCIVGTDQDLIDALIAAGTVTGERLWQLPLWNEFTEAVKSKVADVQNISNQSGGGVITGAAFLKEFVDKTAWAHIDIGATANDVKGKAYLPKGATGVGVRLLVQFLKKRLEK